MSLCEAEKTFVLHGVAVIKEQMLNKKFLHLTFRLIFVLMEEVGKNIVLLKLKPILFLMLLALQESD